MKSYQIVAKDGSRKSYPRKSSINSIICAFDSGEVIESKPKNKYNKHLSLEILHGNGVTVKGLREDYIKKIRTSGTDQSGSQRSMKVGKTKTRNRGEMTFRELTPFSDHEEDEELEIPTQSFANPNRSIPPPGESFDAEPFGSFSLEVPFDQVYILGEVINSGHFGTVYKAHHVLMSDTAEVAVKIVEKASPSEDAAVIEEAKVMRDIRELDNIVTLFDFYMDDEKFYVVQELAAGGDVFDRLVERKTYNENDARELGTLLLNTVLTLHNKKLIHRDLKPENILLKSKKSDSKMLLCDFGCAKYLPADGSGLWTHCGTPQFSSPEIVEGVEYWEEVDMWSIGCIMFMLLCGHQAFEGSSAEIYQYIATADYGFDGPIWDKISDEAKDFISNLMILDKTVRLTAKQALNHRWFSASTCQLKSTDLKETKDGIKHYVEKVRAPADLHYIDEKFTGDEDFKYTITQPGDSLKVDPLGSLRVPFHDVYKLDNEIKSGTFGVMYGAHHVSSKTHSEVAVKVISRDSDNDEAFLCEASILKDIRDLPNVVRLFDFYMDDKNMYMVHELTSGADAFDRLLEKKTYKEDEARKLAKKLLKAVKHIHSKKLLHRNLKPENLTLKGIENDSDILLRGFGYAKYLPSGKGKGKGLFTRCGSPAYVAPEIVEGIEYWEEVDMWSTGCILFTLLGGYQPFEGSNDLEMYQLIVSADYGFDGTVWDRVGKEAKDLISKLLVLDTNLRLSAKQALKHDWFSNSKKSKSTKKKEKEKEKESPKKKKKEKIRNPLPGDSLDYDPLGSIPVPFDTVYELGDVITSGAFGVMYKTRHKSAKSLPGVAVKVIDRKGDIAETFLYEAEILKGIRELPNIVTLFDFYMDKKKMYLVQEVTSGEDVFDRLLKRKIYSESEARALCVKLLTAVQSIHNKKLIHRNLKPENMMLKTMENDSDILLRGFGYAKYLPSGEDSGAGLWTRCGTPAFVAPEIVEGIEYWEEVDMWSVGCILFMLLGGYKPFEGENEFEIYQLISTANYNFDDHTWNVVSGQAKFLISKLLVVERTHRLTATQALQHEWFSNTSQLHSYIPWAGESLKVEPLGSLSVSFDKVYKLGDVISKGLFGVMYKAHHVSMQASDEVSVKIIDRKGDYAEAYIRDTSILKGINDLQHVVKLLDFYMDDCKMYVVYGHTAVGDVFDRLSEVKKYSERDARDLFKYLLKAAQSIHARKLVHRNLKPENLILKTKKSNSDILVGGFGYAKYLPRGDDIGSGLWTLCGTPAFTAPEILDGIEYFEEVDMWSAGCTLFQLLSGSRPFVGESTYEIYDLISRADYGFDGSAWKVVSKEAKSLVSKLMTLDRKKRLTATKALESSWFSIRL